MTAITLTSREFNQDASRAKRAARQGPVFITDRGRPAHVLLTLEAYQALQGHSPSIAQLLAMTQADAVVFEPPRMGDGMYRAADLS